MIRLDGGYAIEVDSTQYTLGVPKWTSVTNKKTGEVVDKEILTDCKYYGTLDLALMGYWKLLRRKGLAKFEGSLREALEVIKKQDDKILKQIQAVREDF